VLRSVEPEDPREWSSEKVATFVRSLGTATCFQSTGHQVIQVGVDDSVFFTLSLNDSQGVCGYEIHTRQIPCQKRTGTGTVSGPVSGGIVGPPPKPRSGGGVICWNPQKNPVGGDVICGLLRKTPVWGGAIRILVRL
jgi:hypothetical protein